MDAPTIDGTLTRTQANNGAPAAANDPAVDRGIGKYDSYSQYEEGVGFGAGLYDARNAFGELNRYHMLWNVGHLWRKGSRMAFNHYCHYGQIFVLNKVGLPAHIIHSKEGVDQGCTFSMNLYDIGLLPLA